MNEAQVRARWDAMTPPDNQANLSMEVLGLRAGVTLSELQTQARALTDMQAARNLNVARQALFKRLKPRPA